MGTPRTKTLGDGGVRRTGRERDGGVSGQLGVRTDRGRTRPRREPGIRDHAAVWVIGLCRDGGPAGTAARGSAARASPEHARGRSWSGRGPFNSRAAGEKPCYGRQVRLSRLLVRGGRGNRAAA